VNRAKYNKGRRLKKSNNWKKTIGIIVILMIIITIIIILKFKAQDNTIVPEQENMSEQDNTISVVLEDENLEEPITWNDEIVSVEDMPNKMGIYSVVGKIVIEKINVEKYILDRTTQNSLDLAVTKFEGTEVGPEINTIGNFMIMGHNYPGIFKKLKDLKIGDEFYLVGKDGRKVTYVICEIYTLHPENDDEEKALINQETNGKRIVKLITCNPGAKSRLILKAEEKI